MTLDLTCPPRVTVGEDLDATVHMVSAGPLEITSATLRWVCRVTRHEKAWVFSVRLGTYVWSEVFRSHEDHVVSSATLRPLLGTHPPGAPVEATVRLEAVDVTPSAVLIPDFGDVTSFVEVAVTDGEGRGSSKRQKLWVRPARPRSHDPALTVPIGDRPGPLVALRQGPSEGPLYGEFYRYFEGTAVLAAGAEDLGPGRLTFDMVCAAQWQVHYMKARRPEFKLTKLEDFARKEFHEVSMERERTEPASRLGTLPTPGVPAGGRVELAFSWKAPKSTAQTCETPDSSISWRLETLWDAGPVAARSSTPIVMAMPLADAEARDPAWRRLLRRGDRSGPSGK